MKVLFCYSIFFANTDETSSLDHEERVSLSSNTEVVIVGDLIDISSDPGSYKHVFC